MTVQDLILLLEKLNSLLTLLLGAAIAFGSTSLAYRREREKAASQWKCQLLVEAVLKFELVYAALGDVMGCTAKFKKHRQDSMDVVDVTKECLQAEEALKRALLGTAEAILKLRILGFRKLAIKADEYTSALMVIHTDLTQGMDDDHVPALKYETRIAEVRDAFVREAALVVDRLHSV